MSLFDTLIVQPIFNLLIAIYGLIPGGDFGIALIIFTVLVRLIMWPLVKKQLHQTKVMRAIQPELKKIKAKAKGDKQAEGRLMMELYRERGVNPFGSIGLLLIQLPIFIALFRVIQIITTEREKIGAYTYSFLEQLGPIAQIINDPKHEFNETLLGVISLTAKAVDGSQLYFPLIILAAIAAALQYVQAKQVTPEPTSEQRLRDMFKASAKGAEVDQADVSALMSRRMIVIFPFLTFIVAIYFPGALVLYYAVTSGVAVIQQKIVLSKDVEEMEVLADEKTAKTKDRAANATEATIVTPIKKSSPKKSGSKKRKRR